MTLALLFWILMLIWLVVGVWRDWPNYPVAGSNLLLFLVIGVLGWRVFGPAIHG